jgi:hypothetical protein
MPAQALQPGERRIINSDRNSLHIVSISLPLGLTV